MSTTYVAGDATAYAAAVLAGYEGTFEQFCALMASYADVGQTAVDAKDTAVQKAGEASNSATAANTDALKAEGYAVGKQNGSDVGSGSTYYHANAKYYKEQADSDASAASGSASSAAADALKAEGYAQGKQNGSDVASGSPYYHANAKYYSEQAAASADAAEDSADLAQAAVNALVITDTASGAIVSFSDGADGMPLKSLVIDIDPVQDLHGYDNPWPAGGGKNKWSTSSDGFENCTISSTGEKATGTNRGCTGYIPCAASTQYVASGGVKATSSQNYIFSFVSIAFYDSSKNFISRESANNVDTLAFTTPETAAFMRASEEFSIAVLTETATAETFATFKRQIELGATASSYSPYSNLCPISGRTGANVTAAGKNLYNDAQYDYLNISRRTWGSNAPSVVEFLNILPAGSYSVYFNATLDTAPASSDTKRMGFSFIYNDGSNHGIDAFDTYTTGAIGTKFNVKKAFTIPAGAVGKFTHAYSYGGNASDTADLITVTGVGFTRESVPTEYEPYHGTTKSISFGSTIYGGTDEVVSGSGKKTMEIVDLGDLEWTAAAIGTSGNRFYAMLPTAKIPASTSEMPNLICSVLKTKLPSQYTSAIDGITIYTNGSLQIYHSAYAGMTSEEFTSAIDGVQLCYELATPSDFSTTPITDLVSLLGDNNIWNDCGDTTVEYVADPKLYINKVVAALA